MNIIRNIESATLLTIGTFCAAAVMSIVLHGANVLSEPQLASNTKVIELPPVIVIGKRISAINHASMQAPVAG